MFTVAHERTFSGLLVCPEYYKGKNTDAYSGG